MFSRDGYVPLARLWEEFEKKLGRWCLHRAVAIYRSDSFQPQDAFGTALDLCEDIFLHELDAYDLSLVPVSGEVVTVAPVLPKSAARLLEKLTVLESSIVANSPDEAGPGNEWLNQMGSTVFRRAENATCWPDLKEPAVRPDWETRLAAHAFHTLPVLFERPSFVIARQLPPWTNDLLEDVYLRTFWDKVAGSSICLTEAEAVRLRRAMSPSVVAPILQRLVPSVDFGADEAPNLRGGRPRLVEDVIEAYRALGLLERPMTWKAKQAEIKAMLGRTISERTMRRAEQLLRA